jgi:ABC-type antimicrobial peptide transport system permease subunit
MAVGASTGNVMRMVLRDSFGMVGTGIVIGLPCAYGIGKILNTMLFRLKPLDPATLCLTFLILFGVALVTALAPARRAARIDPLAALREE